MSEKEVAGLSFPSPDGKFDYQGFSGDSVRLHKFCEDLFNYYWDAAKNRSVVVDELYKWINKNQDALKVFKQIAEKGELVNHEKLVTSLENNGLIVEDGLTHLGDIVNSKPKLPMKRALNPDIDDNRHSMHSTRIHIECNQKNSLETAPQ